MDPQVLKAMNYLSFLSLNFASNEKKILLVLHHLPSSVLFQILFAINMPAWVSGAHFRTLAKKQLKERHSGEAWLKQVDLCIVEEKLHSV